MEVQEQEKPLLAWRVEINATSCIVFAATKDKAKWIAVKGYWDAGYGRGRGTWPRPSAVRVERLDRSPLRHKGPKGWSPDYAESMGTE